MKKIIVIYTVFMALFFTACAHSYYKEQGWDRDGKETTIHNTNNIFN